MAYVTSDYQDYMEGKPGAKDLYQGEFMVQYDLAEERNVILLRRLY